MTSVRTPPRPPYQGLAGVVWQPDGSLRRLCSMCGTAVTGRRRSWCGEDCVRLWWIAIDGGIAFHWLSLETGPVCWVCWSEPAEEVDHVRPLWSLSAEERLELRWWLPFNLQLIGRACHRAKTRAEAADRAARLRVARVRRGSAEQLGLGLGD